MGSIISILSGQSMLELPKNKKTIHDGITKNTLLQTLNDAEGEVKELNNDALQERFETLREQVEAVLEGQNEKIANLQGEIQSLKQEIKELKDKRQELENTLVLAQATWVWEAHVARFVVDPSTRIYNYNKFNQMEKHLKKNPKNHCWTEIQSKLTNWTDEHKKEVELVRAQRNSIAHPEGFDLDLVESQMEINMSPDSQELMKDMLEMLKMTASLMKFGRLAKFYDTNKHLFPAPTESGKGMDERALKNIISWDRNFEQINGLQSIHHTEAKEYLAKYVNDRRMFKHYIFIIDFIKNGNSKRLGKLAWIIDASDLLTDLSTVQGEALEELKKLLPNPEDESDVLKETIAKLHIPDFLPKHLWKPGIEIVKKFFEVSKEELRTGP